MDEKLSIIRTPEYKIEWNFEQEGKMRRVRFIVWKAKSATKSRNNKIAERSSGAKGKKRILLVLENQKLPRSLLASVKAFCNSWLRKRGILGESSISRVISPMTQNCGSDPEHPSTSPV